MEKGSKKYSSTCRVSFVYIVDKGVKQCGCDRRQCCDISWNV